MAKKSRRVRQPVARPPAVPPTARPPLGRPETPVQPRAASRPAEVRPRVVDFREEYKYVVGDLKRIGILAGLIISALVILSFILR